MSADRHEDYLARHEARAAEHQSQYDPTAQERRPNCYSRSRDIDGRACWTSIVNPTREHLRNAEEHRQAADEHRSASNALRRAESQECSGVSPADRDTSPFEHVEDIASIEVVDPDGFPQAGIAFRPIGGLTVAWPARVIDCHLAALGHQVPEMADCPLVPRNVAATVSAAGANVVVDIGTKDPVAAREVSVRTLRLMARTKRVTSATTPPGEVSGR
jgi:hypothetical protein